MHNECELMPSQRHCSYAYLSDVKGERGKKGRKGRGACLSAVCEMCDTMSRQNPDPSRLPFVPQLVHKADSDRRHLAAVNSTLAAPASSSS